MTELKFSDLVEPVAVDQKTALRITVLGWGEFWYSNGESGCA